MSYLGPDGGSTRNPITNGGSTNSTGIINVSPSIWNNASNPIYTGNHESDDVKAAVLITLNDLIDSLGAVSYIQGAVNLAQAVSNFSSNIELSLGCIAVDLGVVASGLQVASQTFAALDHSLATTFAQLESQMAYFTTDTTLATSPVTAATPLHIINAQHAGGGSNIFSHAWHDITNWGSDAYHGTVNGLESIGVPGWAAVGTGAVVIGGYYVLAGGGVVLAG